MSRKFGYLPDGISRDRRGEEVVISDRLRLTADRWAAGTMRVPVHVTGIDEALRMFV